jgi:hypothetical protein
MNEEKTERKFLFVVSTLYERNSVGNAIRFKREMKEIMERDKDYKAPERVATFTWKSLNDIKPGEQDIVFAGGRDEDEDLVLALKGSGQIIVRYSQLDYNKPYSGRSVEELGYSFIMRKDRRPLYNFIDPVEELRVALADRDPKALSYCLANSEIYPTGYLEECCNIPTMQTPRRLFEKALAEEDKEIDSLNQSLAYLRRGKSVGYGRTWPF